MCLTGCLNPRTSFFFLSFFLSFFLFFFLLPRLQLTSCGSPYVKIQLLTFSLLVLLCFLPSFICSFLFFCCFLPFYPCSRFVLLLVMFLFLLSLAVACLLSSFCFLFTVFNFKDKLMVQQAYDYVNRILQKAVYKTNYTHFFSGGGRYDSC